MTSSCPSTTNTQPQETKFEQLQGLLVNEPPNVAENVIKNWKDIDKQTSKLLDLSHSAGVDQAFKDLKLPPDEFETKLSEFVKLCERKLD